MQNHTFKFEDSSEDDFKFSEDAINCDATLLIECRYSMYRSTHEPAWIWCITTGKTIKQWIHFNRCSEHDLGHPNMLSAIGTKCCMPYSYFFSYGVYSQPYLPDPPLPGSAGPGPESASLPTTGGGTLRPFLLPSQLGTLHAEWSVPVKRPHTVKHFKSKSILRIELPTEMGNALFLKLTVQVLHLMTQTNTNSGFPLYSDFPHM